MAERKLKRVGGEESLGTEYLRPSKFEELGLTDKVIVEGTFLGAIDNDLTGKQDFKFEKEEGGFAVVNGTGHLAYLMSKVSPGAFCQVSYKGKEDYKGKQVHRFDVLSDEE